MDQYTYDAFMLLLPYLSMYLLLMVVMTYMFIDFMTLNEIMENYNAPHDADRQI